MRAKDQAKGSPRGYKATTPSAHVGAGLRRLREKRRLRQDDTAATARQWGLRWSRSVVAAIEAGQRELTLRELILLPLIAANTGPADVERGTYQPVALSDFFSDSAGDYLVVAPGRLIDAATVPLLWAGRAGATFLAMPATGMHRGDLRRMAMATMSENATVVRRLWPGLLDRDPSGREYQAVRRQVEAASADMLAEAEQKAAKRLHTFPLAVAAAARKRWGRSLTEERDRRVAEQTPQGVAPRAAQALRGHVSRVLLEELRPDIEGLKVTRRRSGRK